MKNTKENIESPALGCKLGRAYQIMLGQLGKTLKDTGLDITTSEYLVMRAVYRCPGAQQCEIADLVGKDKAAVCRCIAGLEKKGFLTVESVSYKCLKIFPSDKGLELESRIMDIAAERNRDFMKYVSPGDLEVFIRILDKIISSK